MSNSALRHVIGTGTVLLLLTPFIGTPQIALSFVLGKLYPTEGSGGDAGSTGVNMNTYTDTADRDPFTGRPYHCSVPCRIERV